MLYLLLIAATAIWFVLEHTATGRRLYATGFNADAARLQGVTTDRLRFFSLVASSLLAGFAGVVFASAIGSGSPTAGTPYLLSAYAAAFVGRDPAARGPLQRLGHGHRRAPARHRHHRPRRSRRPPQWATSLFTGVVLIVALAVTSGRVRIPKRLRRRAVAAA